MSLYTCPHCGTSWENGLFMPAPNHTVSACRDKLVATVVTLHMRLVAVVDALDAVLGSDSDMPSHEMTWDEAETLVDRERELGTR